MDWQSQYGDDVWADMLLDLEESDVHDRFDSWRFFSPSLAALPDLEESGAYDGLAWTPSPSQRSSAAERNTDDGHDLLHATAGAVNPEAIDVLLHSTALDRQSSTPRLLDLARSLRNPTSSENERSSLSVSNKNYGTTARPHPETFGRLSHSLRHRLVMVFFRVVHTLLPVICKKVFFEWYNKKYDLDMYTELQRLTLEGMMFAAFAHLNVRELEASPFYTILEGQAEMFEQVRQSYVRLASKHEGSIELVQVTLLLTTWSPYDASFEVNDYWLDEALRHAYKAGIPNGESPHHRILWWCCIVRNRISALALRRPYRLRDLQPDFAPSMEDFSTPEPTSSQAQDCHRDMLLAVEVFLSLCKLSVVIEDILRLGPNTTRWDPWRGIEKDPVHRKLKPVMDIDLKLQEWCDSFDLIMSGYALHTVSSQLRASFLTLRIIAESAKAGCYIRILREVNPDPLTNWYLGSLAIGKAKEASLAVASYGQRLAYTVKATDIPPLAPAYLILPMTVYAAEAYIHRHDQLAQFSWTRLQELQTLLEKLEQRFPGVRHVVHLFRTIEQTIDSLGKLSSGL
ncbi:uncharacterized protein PV06_11031 [Exophiala oligosperma]|uniref:Transcription factor domain-containing protein n=1 Tax=Exophiala oligosperma TaxID=215243 RepID=A0A0D2D383_9EURO|nr:uncharacterized protein PV06_11031 [Exophiala oligosperma]KIW36735.1 hypothetical protein PV06_11031 [Exophiala oligosperma]